MTSQQVPTDPPVIVIGAGISGIACARELRAAGVPVRVLDRGRVVGGRMASRRLDDRPTDLGASYFTVSDEHFSDIVRGWVERDLTREWTDTFTALDATDGSRTTKTGPMRWGAQHGLRSLVEDLARGLDVERTQVDAVGLKGSLRVDGAPAAAVVLAMPDAQARRLLDAAPELAVVADRLTRPSEPTLALAARFAERTWDDDGVFVNHDPALSWIADDGRRRGDDAPVLVAHSTPALAAEHLDDPAAAEAPMLLALRRLLDLGEPTSTHVHRWSLAKPTGTREEPYLLHPVGAAGGTAGGGAALGVCGDGWGPTSKVETAFLSGRALGRALAERLS